MSGERAHDGDDDDDDDDDLCRRCCCCRCAEDDDDDDGVDDVNDGAFVMPAWRTRVDVVAQGEESDYELVAHVPGNMNYLRAAVGSLQKNT